MSDNEEVKGRAVGGKARALALTPERRVEIAKKAVAARIAKAEIPEAAYIGELVIGDSSISCAVLQDGTRLLSERAVTKSFGAKRGGSHWKRKKESADGADLPVYLSAGNIKPFINNELEEKLSAPVLYRTQSGAIAHGLEASLLPKVCNIFLSMRDAGKLHPSQEHIAHKADILMRGLAEVGIIALVDEATGYQRDREKNELAKILEAFVAKELQPYMKTFPPEYYEELFRLRGLKYPPDNPRFRPQYFGILTNDIVYERLAPGLLADLKRKAAKDEKKAHLHRRLTAEIGHPKLREHLASAVTIMKLSDGYTDFIDKLNRIHPRFGTQILLELEDKDK